MGKRLKRRKKRKKYSLPFNKCLTGAIFVFVAGSFFFFSQGKGLFTPLEVSVKTPFSIKGLSFSPFQNGEYNCLDFLFQNESQASFRENSVVPPELKQELDYFFTGLSLPDDCFWVNLHPYQPERIIDPKLACTDMGKILLEADLQLKKDLAWHLHPGNSIGEKFWSAFKKEIGVIDEHNIEIPIRVWIVPDKGVLRETDKEVKIVDARLKVCLEKANLSSSGEISSRQKIIIERLFKSIVLPQLNMDINYSPKYYPLRQVYKFLLLAQWFKRKYGFIRKGYPCLINTGITDGLESKVRWSKEKIWKVYRRSCLKGEYSVPLNYGYINAMYFYSIGGIDFNLGPANSNGFKLEIISGKGKEQIIDSNIAENGDKLIRLRVHSQGVTPRTILVKRVISFPDFLDGGTKDGGEIDEIDIVRQAERIAKGDIKGLVLDERGKVVAEEEYLKKLRLELGRIFVAECKKIAKGEGEKKLYNFWKVVEEDKVFLEEIGKDFLTNRIRICGRCGPASLDTLATWAYLGIKRYFQEIGSPIEGNKIKDEAKEMVLGALHSWQWTESNRRLLSDIFIVEEMARRGNKGRVMEIGIAAGMPMRWYVPEKMISKAKREALPGITFIELADKLAGKDIELIGADIETVGLKDLFRKMREGKIEEMLRQRYLRPQVSYIRCDLADKLPVKDGSFDIIRVAEVFPYIAQDKLRVNALLNIYRALKENGLLVFVDIDPQSRNAPHIIKDAQGKIVKVIPPEEINEIYRKKGKDGLVYEGRLSWDGTKRVVLKKGDEEPLLNKYLNTLRASLDKKLDGGVDSSPHIVVLGMSHKTASREVRDRFTFTKEEIPLYLKTLKEKEEIKEVMILKTCNRREIYVVTDKIEETEQTLYDFLYSFFPPDVNKEDLKNQVFVKSDKEALSHLFSVICGLDSLAVGETQITGQVKSAYETAKKENTAGEILGRIITQAVKVNRIIRNRFPEISKGDISISGLAVKKAKKVLGDLKDKVCLLLGAGEVQHETWEHLQNEGVKEIIIASRTKESALKLAEHISKDHTNTGVVNVKAISCAEQEKFRELLGKADVVLTATDAPHKPLIHYDFVKEVMQKRQNKPLVFIDMGDPGDVADEVNEIRGVYRYSLDQLQDVVESHRKAVTQGASIIEREVAQRWPKIVKREKAPLAISYLKEVSEIWEKWQKFYIDYYSPLLKPQAKSYLEKTLKSLTNKYLHPLRKTLKNIEPSLQEEAIKYLSLFWCEEDVGKDFSAYFLSQPVILELEKEWEEIFHQELDRHKQILLFTPEEQKFIQYAGERFIHSLLVSIDKALVEVSSRDREYAKEFLRRFFKQGDIKLDGGMVIVKRNIEQEEDLGGIDFTDIDKIMEIEKEEKCAP